MADLKTLMRSRDRHQREIKKLDERILTAIEPLIRKELFRRRSLHYHEISELAASLPAPQGVVSKALSRLVEQGSAERGFDGMNDIYIAPRRPFEAALEI